MKKLLQKHISSPYALLVLAALLFGLVMTGLIPIGNGYIINPQCTENGKFITHSGTGCGGFSLFGMDHFLWHPRVTIAIGIILLFIEALAWAALLFAAMLVLPLLRDLEFKQNPLTGKGAQRTYLSLLIGLLLTIHFSASTVQSTLLKDGETCATEQVLCEPCPGVVAKTPVKPVREDYGWPFHIVKKTFSADTCGMQPVKVRTTYDPFAFVYNVAFWALLSYAVLHWLSGRSKLFR